MAKPIRIPTDAEVAAYRGEHCFALWRKVGPAWTCPACGRDKRQIMRWTRRGARPCIGQAEPFMGWMAGLHTHHDHAAPAWAHEGRFEHTVICDQCNAADGQAKRALRLPATFSFSPTELRQFVVAVPHGSHRLRLDVALLIFKEVIGWNSAVRSVGPRTCESTETPPAATESGSTVLSAGPT